MDIVGPAALGLGDLLLPAGREVVVVRVVARRVVVVVGGLGGAGRRVRGDLGGAALAAVALGRVLGEGVEDVDEAVDVRVERGAAAPGQEEDDSTSLQRGFSARARSRKNNHASRPFREMITRPKISRNEWKTTEI